MPSKPELTHREIIDRYFREERGATVMTSETHAQAKKDRRDWAIFLWRHKAYEHKTGRVMGQMTTLIFALLTIIISIVSGIVLPYALPLLPVNDIVATVQDIIASVAANSDQVSLRALATTATHTGPPWIFSLVLLISAKLILWSYADAWGSLNKKMEKRDEAMTKKKEEYVQILRDVGDMFLAYLPSPLAVQGLCMTIGHLIDFASTDLGKFVHGIKTFNQALSKSAGILSDGEQKMLASIEKSLPLIARDSRLASKTPPDFEARYRNLWQGHLIAASLMSLVPVPLAVGINFWFLLLAPAFGYIAMRIMRKVRILRDLERNNVDGEPGWYDCIRQVFSHLTGGWEFRWLPDFYSRPQVRHHSKKSNIVSYSLPEGLEGQVDIFESLEHYPKHGKLAIVSSADHIYELFRINIKRKPLKKRL